MIESIVKEFGGIDILVNNAGIFPESSEIEKVNQDLARYESIKKFIIADEEFTVENGLLTPTFKVKKKLVLERPLPAMQRYSSMAPRKCWMKNGHTGRAPVFQPHFPSNGKSWTIQ